MELESKTFAVRGMECEACVGHVQRALSALTGMQSATVSLEDQSATVLYDSGRVALDDIHKAVTDEGYEADL